MPEDQFIKLLRGLRQVREYTPEPVPDDAVQDMLEVGRWSGSASNKQPIELVVVRDDAVKRQIAEGGVRSAAGAALGFVLVTTDDPERRELEALDEGRMAERLMLAAAAHGLGAGLGTLKGEGPNTIRQALGVPAGRRVWVVVTVGRTDVEARRARTGGAAAGRKPMADFVHWDRYSS
jgi:nitroreductase